MRSVSCGAGRARSDFDTYWAFRHATRSAPTVSKGVSTRLFDRGNGKYSGRGLEGFFGVGFPYCSKWIKPRPLSFAVCRSANDANTDGVVCSTILDLWPIPVRKWLFRLWSVQVCIERLEVVISNLLCENFRWSNIGGKCPGIRQPKIICTFYFFKKSWHQVFNRNIPDLQLFFN